MLGVQEQHVIKNTINFLGMEIYKTDFYTGIAIAIVSGAIGVVWFFIRRKIYKKPID